MPSFRLERSGMEKSPAFNSVIFIWRRFLHSVPFHYTSVEMTYKKMFCLNKFIIFAKNCSHENKTGNHGKLAAALHWAST